MARRFAAASGTKLRRVGRIVNGLVRGVSMIAVRVGVRTSAWTVAGLLIALVLAWPGSAVGKGGFDLSNSELPRRDIKSGGPPKDGIPAVDHPTFLRAADAATWLRDEDRVLGLVFGRHVRAYPIAIMNYHEIVNDQFGEHYLVITYCPLCGTGMAFESEGPAAFGVSGLLYNSDVLLYDRRTESLWSQLLGRAISGPRKGEGLTMIPLQHTTWRDWSSRHPETFVLSRQTGHRRDYSQTPYAGYESSSDIYFRVANRSRRYHPKEWVVGLEINGAFKAYPFSELSAARLPIEDELGGAPIRVHFDADNGRGWVSDAEGAEIASVLAFWFAWYAFHPETEVFEAGPREGP
jgi:hypothetical protein